MSRRAEAGMRGIAARKDEERRAGEREEDEIDGDDVVEDLLVASRDGDDDGDDPLQGDGDDRHVRLRMDPRDAPEEHFVLGHGEVDARRGEHPLAEKAEGGNGDADGDELLAALAEGNAHYGR